MKRILSIFLAIFVLCNTSYAKDFIVSCEGYIDQNTRSIINNKTKRKTFYEDYRITVVNKKIIMVYIEESSHWYGKIGFYSDRSNLEVVGNGEILKIKEKDYNSKSYSRKNTRMRISIVNGTSTGSWSGKFYNDDGSELASFSHDYFANCSGTDSLLASLRNDPPGGKGVPKIDDNEVVAAASGTGFFISKQGHMVTNNHVIEGCTYIKAIYNGTEHESKVVAVDKVNDLAIIKSEIIPKKIYSVSNQDAQLLEEVIVAGYPLGKKISAAIKATSGTVTALAGIGDNYAEFQTDAALNSGNSGGPIINYKGNVVGVAVSKIQQEGVDSFNFGVKSSILKIFANANGINFLPPSDKAMKKKDLGALITEATIYLDCWMTGKEIKRLLAKDQKSQKAFYRIPSK